jgi:exopolysaccharide production protein ExoQ
MSYIYYPNRYPKTRRAARRHSVPWLFFGVLSVALFFIVHFPVELHRTWDSLNNQSQEVIAQEYSSGSLVRQIVLVILGVFALTSLVTRRSDRRLRMDGLLSWVLVVFTGWAVLSLMWSDDPPLTLKRVAILVILSTVAVAMVQRFTLHEIVLWMFFNMASFLVVSIIVEMLAGTFEPFAANYRFSGTQHPNGEAIECGVLFLSALAAGRLEKQYRWIFWTFGALALIFLFLTRSRTSLVATLLGLAAYVIILSPWKTMRITLPVLGVLVPLVILLISVGVISKNAMALGREDVADSPDSISGRTVLWNDVGPYIRQQPIEGHGYEAFWTPAHIAVISDKLDWGVPDSHSAYVDCLLSLGFVGLTMYCLSFIGGLWRVFAFYQRTRDADFAFLAALLVFCIVNGSLESALGEGGVLTLISLLVLFRLALVPFAEPGRVVLESFPRREEICAI